MTTCFVLVRHLDSQPGVEQLEIGGGQFVRITQNAAGRNLIDKCRKLFPAAYAQYADWIYEKSYATVPPARIGQDPSGFGDIPYEVEDLLLALRLRQPGDISFVAQAIVGDNGNAWFQQPYRYFGAIASTHPYRLDPDLIPSLELLLRVVRLPEANSVWFSVAKRFFLYGGAKEFNPYIGELDRIVDLAVALEAVLVFETDHVARMLRNRAIALLGLQGESVKSVKRLLNDFYGYRSKIAHGDPIPIANAAAFHLRMSEFESLVRRVLTAALQAIPADAEERKRRLAELSTVSDADRIQFLIERAKNLESADVKTRVLAALQT